MTANGAVATDPDRDVSRVRMPPSMVDPKGARSGGRFVLLVGTVEDIAGSLTPRIRSGDVVKVVVRAVGQDDLVLDWLDNEDTAFPHAWNVAQETTEQLPGEPVTARAGEADTGHAIRDALATFPADEILIAVDGCGWDGYGWTVADSLEANVAAGASQNTIAGVPIRIVTIAAA